MVPPSVRELAIEINTSPKTIRAWMRLQDWRAPVEHRQAWLLTPDQVAQIRQKFSESNSVSSARKAVTRGDDPLPDLTVAELLTNYRNVLTSLRMRHLISRQYSIY